MATKQTLPPPSFRPRYDFDKRGTQYVLSAEDAGIMLRLGRLKRSGQELSGELQVAVNWEGVRTVDGILHQARLNLSSTTARNTLIKTLRERTQTASDESMRQMDWADAVEHLCQQALSRGRQGEPIISMNGTMPKARAKYDIKPILPHGVATFVYGPGGIGKSAFALALAMSVAKGMEIVPGLAPQVKGPVLYLDWETDPYVVRERSEYLSKGHDFTTTKDLLYRRCARPLADDADELAAIVAERGVKMVVIDSCGPAMGTSGEYGDANESTIKLFDAIRRLAVTVLVVDHVSKQQLMRDRKGEVIGSMPYGSVYKVNLARAMWELQNGTSPTDDDIHIRLINTKVNDAKMHLPIDLAVFWDSDEGIITFSEDENFVPEEYIPEDGKPGTQLDLMVEALRGKGDGMTTTDLAPIIKSSPTRARNIINSKKAKDVIEVVYGSSPPRYRLVRRGGI
jgi:hypothetical protein